MKENYIPVAIDQWNTRRQQDSVGDFWRLIAGQGPRHDFTQTTQGLYVVAADGKLIAFNNNRGPDRVRDLLKKSSDEYQHPTKAQPLPAESVDPRFANKLPTGAAIVRVSAQIPSGYKPTQDKWQLLFQSAISRDNLWITANEQEELKQGQLPTELAQRIARFHLVDNTRGEPPIWRVSEVRKMNIEVEATKLNGTFKLETDDGKRGYEGTLNGEFDFDDTGRLSRLAMFVDGKFWGSGPFTGDPPPGKFPLKIAFTLADGTDLGDRIPPHASRGWLDGYLHPNR